MMVVMAVMVVAERRGEHENKAFSILNVIVPGMHTAVHTHMLCILILKVKS